MSTASVASVRVRLLSSLAVLLLLAGLAPTGALAVAPTSAPTLLAPADSAVVSKNPNLIWTAVSGAVKYRVQLSTDPLFGSFVYNVDTYNTKATPPTDLPLGTLYWRVAATDGSTGIGPFASSQFSKQWGVAPTLIAPADDAVLDFPSQPVLFTWNPLPGAKSYTLDIDDADDFIGATSYTTNNTSYSLIDPQTVGQEFFWRLRATSSNTGVVSQYSETRSYTFTWATVPTLLTPANTTGVDVQDLVFSWQPVLGAKYYDLQVSPNGDWANNLTLQVLNIRGTRYSPPTTLDNGSYFWRVRAKDAVLNLGGWSLEWQFTRGWPDRPTSLTPAWTNGDPPTVVDVPTFSWTPVFLASYYEIEVSEDINFSPGDPTTQSCFTNRTTYTPYTSYMSSGTPGSCSLSTIEDVGIAIYWHVRAIDDPQGVLGLWSNTGSSDTFRFIRDPASPTQLTPTNGAAVETPVLSWSPVAGATQYKVTIKKSDKTTNAGGTPVTTYATSFTPIAALAPADGPFYWFVQAVDGNGVRSAAPADPTRSFTVTAPTTSTNLTLLTPTSGSSSVRMPSMTWEPYTGAAYYKVWYGADGFFYGTPLSGSTKLPYAGFTYAGLTLAPNTYEWYVEAFDGTDASLQTSAHSFFTIDASETLPGGDYTGPVKCTPSLVCDAEPDTPTLTWNSVPLAGWYEVTIANDANFTNVLRQYGTSYDRLTPRESLVDNQAGQAFYWFVRPCIDSSRARCGPGPTDSTANDNASAFQKHSEAVELVSPTDAASVTNQVSFVWTDYLATNGAASVPNDQEAKQYKIEVSLAADFASIFDSATVDQTTYTPAAKTYPEGPLYWRVWAIDNSGNNLTKSVARLVTKASNPVFLTFPGNSSTVTGVPYFQWAPKTYAATYTVEVYKNGDLLFSPTNKVLTATTKFSAWSPTTSLARGDYAWRVRWNDADGRAAPWSVGRTFHLLPVASTLTGPAAGAVFRSNNLFFTWSAVTGAVQYKFEVSTSCAFSSIYSSQTTVMTAWAPTTKYADGAYCWRVSALNAAGNVLSTSASRTFTKDATAPTVTVKAPTTSAPLKGPFTVTFSEAVTGVSTSTFKLALAANPATTYAGVVTVTSPTTAQFVPNGYLVPGESYTVSLTSGITDLAGNPLVATSWTVRTTLTIDSVLPVLVQTWDRDTSASASGGGFDASRKIGTKTTFTFTGTNVTILGRRASDGGKADVYLDGVKQTTIDFYNAATQYQVNVWSKSGLTSAKHTVELRVLGTKQAASSATWVYLDAFKVGTTAYEENNVNVVDSFRTVANASAYGGSYLQADHTPSTDTTQPTYKLVFRGTDVAVYATKTSASGKADVYVDGVKIGATLDLYAATTTFKSKIFDSPTLADGTHTLLIKILGSKQAASTGTDVSVDQVVIK